MRAEPKFDDAIHALTRLRLCALLRPVQSAEFGAVKDMLKVSDANLSKTVRALAEMGYIATSKQRSPERHDARLTTLLWLTEAGKRAFDGHLSAITALSLGPGVN